MAFMLVSFSNEGFECVEDITKQMPDEWDKAQVVRILAGQPKEPNPLNRRLTVLTLRAQVNSHRDYEIYIQEVCDEVVDDFIQLTEDNPQAAADIVREKHFSRIYGDRPRKKKILIT